VAQVLCTGNMVLDILVRSVDLPEDWAGTAVVESIEQCLGGNGANSAYTLGRLGVPVRLVGIAGADAFGDYVLARLASAGVDTGAIRRSPAGTATTVVLINKRGDRRFLHRLGVSAEMCLTAEEFAREIQPEMTHYHLATPFTLPRMRAVYPELLRTARDRGLQTSLDTQWDWQGKWMTDLAPCLPYVDLLFVNEDEARMLTGTSEPAGAAAVLRRHGASTIVFKRGGSGCTVMHGAEQFTVPAFPVPVVDTTGAGDCFAGAYVAALVRGLSHPEAARLANAVGALVVRTLGAVDGVLDWQGTMEWMAAKATVA
jgi:sugar/nucleoside kinase (ribokinase family)